MEYLIDYHIHLENGPYTIEWVERFWKQAKKRGLKEIGITEHTHRFKEFRPVYRHLYEGDGCYDFMQEWLRTDFQHSINEYIELLERARDKGIPLKIGIEADFFSGKSDLIKQILAPYPFDYVLGSVHVIDKWAFDFSPDHGWQDRSVDSVYVQYIEILKEAISSQAFDVFAHLDVIKVFGHRPVVDQKELWNQILAEIARQGLCIEISTAGLRKPVGEIYPAEYIILTAANLGIPITIASDAHMPKDVGDRWELAVKLAQEYGYESYVSFEHRVKSNQPLPKIS